MKHTKYLLIGGGVAASQAAKLLRQREPEATITLVGQEPVLPYDRPPLSKEFLRGEMPREKLFYDPEMFFDEKHIELLLGVTVEELDTGKKQAVLENGIPVAFEKALIATGGRPIRLQFPGSQLAGIHYLRTIDDATAIAAEAKPGKKAIIIGAGFIGIELAASLTRKGVHVTVLEALPQIWSRFADSQMAGFFQAYCTSKGVIFRTDDTITACQGNARVTAVVTRAGQELTADFVCVGVGITPNVELARQAGLAVDNGIVVNECLQTSHPDIYAAGDVVNYPDSIFGKRRRVEHWGHAEYCGQLAALNMAGGANKYELLSYVWSDIFDLHLEFAGDESAHDQVIIRGRFEDKSFIALYLQSHRLQAYFAINTPEKEFPPLKKLIKRKTDLRGKESLLADPNVAIKEIG